MADDVAPVDPAEETHQPFAFVAERAVSTGPTGRIPNLFAWAAGLRKCMLQLPSGFVPPVGASQSNELTNPWSLHLRWLVPTLIQVINDMNEFANATSELPAIDADLRRVRLISELELYAARVLDGLFKQLLHCTTFDPPAYNRSAIGGLIRNRCKSCEKDKKLRHTIDLPGSLAHRYKLCGEYDQCMKKAVRELSVFRNKRAAHATVDPGELSGTSRDARRRVAEALESRGSALLHVLSHLEKVEDKIGSEIYLFLKNKDRQIPPIG
jgi:hypothetical protein